MTDQYGDKTQPMAWGASAARPSAVVPPPEGGADAEISSATVDFDFSAEVSTRTLVDRSRAEETFVSATPNSDSRTRSAPSGNHVALPVGYGLHEFTIESLLGMGGFGITYLARDNNLQTQVAIKEYLPHDLAIRADGQTVCPRTEDWDEEYRVGLERFLAESRVLAGFRHPNIVRITRFFEANRTAYMVMDYERGQPLRDWLLHHSPVSEETLLKMFVPLLEGLEVVHKAGVLHRDIKPANIYVRETDGSLVLLDFGAARQTSGNASRSLTSIVTPGYAPFEQYHARGAQGPWSDLYAMGGVLYWLVTGQKPLEAPSRMKEDVMAPAAKLVSGRFSHAFLAAIDWALRPDEVQRPRSVAEFKAALTGQVAVPEAPVKTAVPGNSVPATAKPSKKGLYSAIAAAGVLVLALVGFMVKTPSVTESASASAAAAAKPEELNQAPKELPPAAKAAAPVAVKKESVKAHKVPPADVPVTAAPPVTAGSATVSFEVIPFGEVYENGHKLGTSPPLKQLKVAPGTHKFEIRGTQRPYFAYYTVEVKAGETKKIWVKFGD